MQASETARSEQKKSKSQIQEKPVSDNVIPVVEQLKAKSTHLGKVLLSEIVPSKTNPRQEITDLDELTSSVKRFGVLQPILVRLLPESRKKDVGKGVKYELICGERRYLSSLQAGVKDIPAMQIELPDTEVLEVQLVENGQRKDVHPMDEAETFEALSGLLREKYRDVIAEIAGRVGKQKSHIIRRMALLSLPKSARVAFRKGLFTQETAVLIARIPNEKLRTEAAKEILGNENLRSFKEARNYIEENFMLSLKDAPFSRSDVTLCPKAGACVSCPKRTGNQQTLFSDIESSDVCTDPACFSEKRKAEYDRRAKKALADGIEVLSDEASEKVFTYGDHLNYNSGYLDPAQVNHEDPKRRTWKQLLGKNAPKGTLAKTRSGAAVILWDEKEVRRILKENSPKELRTVLENKAEAQEKSRSERKEKAMQKETLLRVHAELLGRAEKDVQEKTLLRALIHAVSDSQGAYVGKVTEKALARISYKSVKTLLDQGSVPELRAFVLECAIGDLSSSWKAQQAVSPIAVLLGVDQKGVLKTVKAEWDAKKQARRK